MRQIGYLAAAGIYALNNNISRLVDDHNKAKEISIYINKLPFVNNVSMVETNIVIFELNNDYDDRELIKKFQINNIKISEMGGGKLRMVTHLDYTNIMHEKVLSFLKSLS
jgi:threonine aldolase